MHREKRLEMKPQDVGGGGIGKRRLGARGREERPWRCRFNTDPINVPSVPVEKHNVKRRGGLEGETALGTNHGRT